ncbi:hypothetical protein OESDEN_07683 [Oesophagostomum dentatum]|uniref:CHK kinase-like domain-containing protein n=1 Tax=Oesophagostomum dentatum TaxID=61180 RepID=A0A0B1T5A8_OESDE|nr:hypothetical protein OESDEN_07683 [Oesophagostomum dentatum]
MEFVEDAEIRHFFHNVKPEELSDVVSKAFRDLCTTSKELRPSGEVLEKMIEELLDLDLVCRINAELGMKDVFVHGDFWSANLLWTKTARGVKFNSIIDHQLAHFGCGAEDLCRVFITTLSGKDRRENSERLLEEFHGYLVQYCEEELPFTLDQLRQAYRRLFPLAGILLSDVFEGIMKIALRTVPNEEKTAAGNILSEKILALFEDMVFFAERNRRTHETMQNSNS